MILPLIGPLAIHTYGLCIAAGVVTALVLAYRNTSWQQHISHDNLVTLINLSIIAGIIGGRMLSIITDHDEIDSWADIFVIWDGGFSVLGSALAIIVALSLYAFVKKISLFAILDLFGFYAPLIQAFGRVGCYFAGCCHGLPTSLPWGITYTDPLSLAPLCTRLHPTQLYNVVLLTLLFIGLHVYARRRPCPGKTFAWSLGGISLIRFGSDFWRGDRGLLIPCGPVGLSMNQVISVLLILFSILIFVIARYRARHRRSR